jgi:Fe-S cluster assembly protein SufD
VNQLVDLPNRRVEAWKYSDLRAALGERAQFAPEQDRAAPEVRAALTRGGVIGALAAQTGAVEDLVVRAGEHAVRVDRLSSGQFGAHLLNVVVEPAGSLTRVVVQADANENVVLDAARVTVSEKGAFRQIVLAEGARLARVETHVEIVGHGAEVELNGVYMAGPGRHADLTSIIEHQVGCGATRQLIKGVARKRGRGVFQGKIVVAPHAQKTDARQYHHGMLLEEGAEIFAKPELMIYADDVQCAHGNTAGGLDERALFYMRSRGLPEAEARALLIEAFLVEAIPDDLEPAIRGELTGRVAAWLQETRT